MDQLFDTGPGTGHGQFLQQSAQLHDKDHFAGGKILTDTHRRDQRKGHQHVRLDVKGCHQADDGFQNNGNAAENDGHPCQVKGEGVNIQQTADNGNTGNGQQGDVLFDAAKLQQLFQFFHQGSHRIPPFYTHLGICALYI